MGSRDPTQRKIRGSGAQSGGRAPSEKQVEEEVDRAMKTAFKGKTKTE
jgi:hypothetical protein